MATSRRWTLLATTLAAAAACVPTQRAGPEGPSATTSAASGPGDDWSDWDRAGGDGGMSIPDGGDADADATPAPPREVLGSAPLAGGGVLVVEAREGGFEFVLEAAGEGGEAVEVEPLGRLAGPEAVSVYFGPGCRRVEAGRAAPLGRWTGEILRCATSGRPAAVLDGRPSRPGCPVAAASPGSYTLTVWPCGSYGAPLGAVTFEVGALAAAAAAGSDGGP